MSVAARTRAVSLFGPEGRMVDVEAVLVNRTPNLQIVGLPDAALREASARVRGAVEHSGFEMPERHAVVGLSPAPLPKQGSAFDLAIALALLAAEEEIDGRSIRDTVHLGELALDGRLRPVAGVLPAVAAARNAGAPAVVLPAANVEEASLVPGIRVIGAASLREVAIHHGAALEPVPVHRIEAPSGPRSSVHEPELADVVGQPEAVEALVVAAAGGHHLLLVGPPGSGKTMLANRLRGLLPDLDDEAAVEATCIASLAGGGAPLSALERRPPWQAPHHSASPAAIVGGGSGSALRIGAAVRAAHGVLFLDEAAEFAPAALEVMRQALESGRIRIDRAGFTATLPGRFQLVLAANPCRCGWHGSRERACTCSPDARRRYAARLSGPLLDRVDLRLRLESVPPAALRLAATAPRRSTAEARALVEAARRRAAERLGSTPWRRNAEVDGTWLRSADHRPAADAMAPLERGLQRGLLTMRGVDRVLRVAWTIADLDAVDRPGRAEIGRALALRGEAA